MKRQMEEEQQAMETKEFSGSAGGGAVQAVVNGKAIFVAAFPFVPTP